MNSILPSSSKIPPLILILLLSVFLYTWKIGDIVFVDEDAAIYAQIASEMLERGDFFTPYYNFEPFHDKQPLVFWLNALSFLLFGKNEFAVRFWQSLTAVLGVYLTFLIAEDLFDRNTALLSSLALSTFLCYFYQARSPLLDIPLTFFILLALYSFIRFCKSKILFYHYFFWASLGFAFMTKGLAGFVLPFLIVASFLFITEQKLIRTGIRKYFFHIIAGFFLFLLVAGPWHFIEYYLHGNEFIENVFIRLTFRRFFKGDGDVVPNHSFFTHFITILFGSLPWSGFLPGALLVMLRDRDVFKRKYFIFSWILVIFLVFSFSAPKRIRYILPLFPALAIGIGFFWSTYLNSEKSFVKKYMTFSGLSSFCISFLILAAVFFAKMKFPYEYERVAYFCLPPLIIFSAGIFISALFLLMQKKKVALAGFIISAFLIYSSLVWASGRYFNEARPMKIFAASINERIKDGEEIASFVGLCPSLIFYTNHKVEYIDNMEKLSAFFQKTHRVYCMAEEKDFNMKTYKNRQKFPVFIIQKKSGYLLLTNIKD